MPADSAPATRDAAIAGAPVLLPKVRARPWGRWLAAVIVLAVLALLIKAAAGGAIQYDLIPELITNSIVLEGLLNVVILAVAAQAGAIVIGVIVALMRTSENPVVRSVASVYVWLFRGLPVLLQLVLWYNLALVFPRIQIKIPFVDLYLLNEPTNSLMTAFAAALLGLGLNESAYMAEIVRAGLNSVDRGQTEAAQAIGMTPGKIMRRVVLPQAMRVIIPPTGNDFVNMIKGTALASVIGYNDLLHAANNLSSHSLAVVETLLAAAFWYMVVVSVANVGQYYIERKFNASNLHVDKPSLWRTIGSSLRTPPFSRAAR